jgi:hypothetical protein
MRWIPFLLLFGCPVEPKDVQDLNQGNNGKNPQNQMSGAGNGQPPSQPQQNGGGQGAGTGGAGTQGAGGAGTQGAGGQPPVQEADAIPLPPENGTAGAQNLNGEGGLVEGGGEGTNPTPNVANEGQAGTPPDVPPSSNLLPMYNQLPQFTDIITGDTVAITLTVSGATSFEFEFVVKREGDGRIYPKVLHKESGATSPTIITTPATLDEPVWLVITADKTGDGPTPDDLVGGPTEAILIDGSDLSLEYTLSEDSEFLKNLPWFSQAMEIPVQGGM